jgi:hypothetical protein
VNLSLFVKLRFFPQVELGVQALEAKMMTSELKNPNWKNVQHHFQHGRIESNPSGELIPLLIQFLIEKSDNIKEFEELYPKSLDFLYDYFEIEDIENKTIVSVIVDFCIGLEHGIFNCSYFVFPIIVDLLQMKNIKYDIKLELSKEFVFSIFAQLNLRMILPIKL